MTTAELYHYFANDCLRAAESGGQSQAARIAPQVGSRVVDRHATNLRSIDAIEAAEPKGSTTQAPQLHREVRRAPQSSSASRFTAGAFGFLNFNQSRQRPEE